MVLGGNYMDINIRVATLDDAREILDIYSYYVLYTAINYDYTPPDLETFKKKMINTLSRYPYLVAINNQKIVGFAYAGSFVSKKAYDWSVETTIYLDHHYTKMGIGKKLYNALENILREMGIINLNACIASPIEEDEYLTTNSIDYHHHLGYRMVGKFHKCGYKYNRWYDMVWMEKMINEHPDQIEDIKCFDDIREVIKEKYDIE